MTERELVAEKLDAEFRAADARLDALQAKAEARHATEEMAEISGLRALRESARGMLADMKQQVSQTLEESKAAVETAVHDLDVAIERVSDRYSEWDSARERRFNARLDEANAKLREWKARADKGLTQEKIREHDALATLEERIALARARVAEWNRDRHQRKAEAALNDAARHLDEAFDAAAKRYD